VVRQDVDGAHVTQLIAPVCTNPAVTGDQSGRLARMILDDLRYEPQATSPELLEAASGP